MEAAKQRALDVACQYIADSNFCVNQIPQVCAFCSNTASAQLILSKLESLPRVVDLTFIYTSAALNVKSLKHHIVLVKVDSFTTWHFQRAFDVVLSLGELHRDYLPGTGHGLYLQAQVEALKFGGTHILATYISDGEYPVLHPRLLGEAEYREIFAYNELCVCEWTKSMQESAITLDEEAAREHAECAWGGLGLSRSDEGFMLRESCLVTASRRSLDQSLLASRGRPLHLGLWMTNKKLRSFIWKRFNNFEMGFGFYAQRRGVRLIPVTHGSGSTAHEPVVSQENITVGVDIIIQKDGFLLGYEPNENSDDLTSSAIPVDSKVPIVDKVEQAKVTFDRLLTMRACAEVMHTPPQLVWGVEGDTDTYDMDNPEGWFAMNLGNEPDFAFPAIAKPVNAEKHKDLQVVFSPSKLVDLAIQPHGWMLQKYIPHNNVLFKVSVIGKEVFFSQRPTLDLDLQDPSLAAKPNMPIGKISSVKETRALEHGITWDHDPPTKAITEIGIALRKALGLNLFGLDLVKSSDDGTFYAIDLNYFPSFVDVPNKNYHFLKFVMGNLDSCQY